MKVNNGDYLAYLLVFLLALPAVKQEAENGLLLLLDSRTIRHDEVLLAYYC